VKNLGRFPRVFSCASGGFLQRLPIFVIETTVAFESGEDAESDR
jgi:hypothetical protein